MLLITAALALLSIAVVWFLRARKPKKKSATRRKPNHRHTAVELVAGTGSCAKAEGLAGTRLLIAEAPVLPLDGCIRCRCAYRRLQDRRELNRRREDDGLQELLLYVGEQKRQGDRRGG